MRSTLARKGTDVDRRPETVRTLPRSVGLAIGSVWGLVGVMALGVVLMWFFDDDMVGAWAEHHEGAGDAFAQGGRLGLERAGFAPPSFLPVGATMVVVGAMIVWVLTVFLRRGYRWGQLGLVALMVGCLYASIALGFVLSPPAVFVAVAVLSLLVEVVALACLWHHDTRAHVSGPWVGGPGPGKGSAAGAGADADADADTGGATHGSSARPA
jgi:hypothetical protein